MIINRSESIALNIKLSKYINTIHLLKMVFDQLNSNCNNCILFGYLEDKWIFQEKVKCMC